MRFAYADPPYHGKGESMYDHPEWDDKQTHLELVDRLIEEFPDGWALSCNPKDLRWLLPHCPEDVRACAWTKGYHQVRLVSVQYAWEPVLLRGGRTILRRNPFVRDWYSAPATREKAVRGAKPAGFCRWILDMLGYDDEQDELVDLYPGSGIMGRVAAQQVL